MLQSDGCFGWKGNGFEGMDFELSWTVDLEGKANYLDANKELIWIEMETVLSLLCFKLRLSDNQIQHFKQMYNLIFMKKRVILRITTIAHDALQHITRL